MTDARQQAEDHRRRVIGARLLRLDDAPGRVAAVIPTGFAALDQALGTGGIPRSAMSEVFGPPSSGKTTLALQWVAHMQEHGLVAAWIDADRTFDPAYATALGVAIENLPLACPESAEQALDMAGRLASSGAVDAVVIDSAAALAPQLEVDSAMTGGAGLHSRVLASGLKALARTVRRCNAAILFVNQTRHRMNPSEGEAVTSAGGPSLKMYAALRLVLEPVGERTVRFRTLKNKAAAAFRDGKLRRGDALGFAKTP